MRLARKRHAWSALVTHTAGGPLVAVHVQLDLIDNLLYDFITGDGRYSLLHVIKGLQKIRQFLADGSFLVVVTLALRLVLNSKHAFTLIKRKSYQCTNKVILCAGSSPRAPSRQGPRDFHVSLGSTQKRKLQLWGGRGK